MAGDDAAILHLVDPVARFRDDGIMRGEEQCLLALLYDILQ